MNVAARSAVAAEILWDYAVIRRSLARESLPAVLARVRATRRRTRPLAADEDARLARAVTLTLERSPLDSRCLMQSLVLLRMLARRGAAGSLVIAVRPQRRDALDAHAWVEIAGRPVLAPAGMQPGRLVTL